jgi:6-phosphogluconolactonase
MQPNLVYVGSYTEPAPRTGEGITIFQQDPTTGALTRRATVGDVVNPSFLAFDPSHRFLFAVNETREYQGRPTGAVSSFAIDPASGALTFLSKQPSEGGDPCHLCTDPTGRVLFVANHEDGRVGVFRIDADGRLAPASDVRQHTGSGPGPTQTGPHAHFVTLDPTGRLVLVVDKGIDQVMIYRLDADHGALVAADPPSARLHAGAAPRHIAFHPNGRYAYVNGEADMTITAFAYDADRGAFTALHHVSTLPAGASRERVSTAQILVAPSGKAVYVSNRGHDSIAIFTIDEATGRVTPAGHVPTGGQTPRNFVIDPAGRFLYAANQNSDTIVCFAIDPASGALTPTDQVTAVGAPVCVLFGPS